jgi:hypothetical protein
MRGVLMTRALLLSSVLSLSCGAALAQKPKKPAAPPPKPAPQTGVKAATQMAGDNGQIGQNYMIGPKGEEFVFTLTGAEYTVVRSMVGGNAVVDALPKAEEKLLLLRFSIQNPQKSDQFLNALGFVITAVDSKDVNHVAPFLGKQGTTDSINIELKPAQKIEGYTAIAVPAEGPVPKLIIQRGEGTTVLRYDLRGKVKPLPAPFAADASGVTARTEIKGNAGTFYPMQRFDTRLDNTAFLTGALGDQSPDEGQRFFLATVTLKNMHVENSDYHGNALKAELTLASGDKVEAAGIAHATRNAGIGGGTLKPNETITYRMFFMIPNDDAPKSLRLQEGEESRAYIFDVSGAK